MSGRDCNRFEVDGLLQLESGEPLDDHFRDCADCQAARRIYVNIVCSLLDATKQVEPCHGWEAAVFARIDALKLPLRPGTEQAMMRQVVKQRPATEKFEAHGAAMAQGTAIVRRQPSGGWQAQGRHPSDGRPYQPRLEPRVGEANTYGNNDDQKREADTYGNNEDRKPETEPYGNNEDWKPEAEPYGNNEEDRKPEADT